MTDKEYVDSYNKFRKGTFTWREHLDNFVDTADEQDKKFLLLQLLQWHKERLGKIIQETPDPGNVKDAYSLVTMVNHKKVADEMIYVLIAELF